LGALVLFLLAEAVLFHVHTFPLVRGETDGIEYMQASEGPILQAHPYHGPGYPLAIRSVRALGVGPFAAGKAVSVAAGLAFLASTWLVLRSLDRSVQANIAVLLLAVQPTVLSAGALVLSDMTAAALCLGGLACLLAPARPLGRHFAAGGVLMALAYLTRYIYLVGLVVPMALLLLGGRPRGGPSRLLLVGAFLAAFLLAALPWSVFLWRAKGSPVWNQNHLNAAFKVYGSPRRDWSRFPTAERYHGWADVVLADPPRFAGAWLGTLARLIPELSRQMPVVALLALIGLLPWARRWSAAKGAFVIVLTCYALACALAWIEGRYLLPLLPLLAILVASGLTLLPDGTVGEGKESPGRFLARFPLRAVAVALAAALLAGTSVWYLRAKLVADLPDEYAQAAAWLAASAPEGSLLLAAKPHIAFFAGLRHLGFRKQGLEEARIEDLPRLLARTGADFVVYDQRYGAAEFPDLSPLLEPGTNPLPDVVERVFRVDLPRALVIFRCRRPAREARDNRDATPGPAALEPESKGEDER